MRPQTISALKDLLKFAEHDNSTRRMIQETLHNIIKIEAPENSP